MSIFMRRTNFVRLRRRTGTVPMWFSWAACCGHADASRQVALQSHSAGGQCSDQWLSRTFAFRLGGLTGAINRSGAYKISEAGLLVCGEKGVKRGTWLLAISETP